MARCNLYNRLSNPTGEFLMFSQFAEDIAKQSTDASAYRVVPSKFAAFEFDFSKLDGIDDRRLGNYQDTNSYNVAIPKIFQNYFENAIANLKEQLHNNGKEWNPEYSNNVLWNTLCKYGLIKSIQTKTAEEDTYNEWTYNELKYVGDIPFYSNRDKDNINYNEIYCHIHANEKQQCHLLISSFGEENPPQSYDVVDPVHILGWNEANYPTNTDIDSTPLTDDDKYILIPDGQVGLMPKSLTPSYIDIHDNTLKQFDVDSEYYKINAVVVFYDINNNMDPTEPSNIYKNIPLGIYFVGDFEENSDNHIMKNIVTKYVTNTASFGQGSSYGLRIMTRFSPVHNSSTYWSETSSGEDVAAISTLFGKLGDLMASVKSFMKDTNSISQDIKDHLAMFKNYRVNVPYIRTVNHIPTWFVNGRNTGRSSSSDYQATINDMLKRIAKLEAERTGEDWKVIYDLLVQFNDSDDNIWDGQIPSDEDQSEIESNINNINQ